MGAALSCGSTWPGRPVAAEVPLAATRPARTRVVLTRPRTAALTAPTPVAPMMVDRAVPMISPGDQAAEVREPREDPTALRRASCRERWRQGDKIAVADIS